MPGNVLLLQGREPQLPWALESLTTVFGMGTGVTSPLSSPGLQDASRSTLSHGCDGFR